MSVHKGRCDQRAGQVDGLVGARRGTVIGTQPAHHPGVDEHGGRGRIRRAVHPAVAINDAHGAQSAASRASNNARTAGSARSRSSANAACPGTKPLPTSIVTSAARPSAPKAAAANDVAIEKKITV